MRLLFLADRLSNRGGADLHLLQMVASAHRAGAEVTIGVGRVAADMALPDGVAVERIRGLSAAVPTTSGCERVWRLVGAADVIHVQNVVNPEAVRTAVVAGRTLATVQDHRVFCPGPGKTLPDGSPCDHEMAPDPCAGCLPDAGYRERLLSVTAARMDALREASLLVLSSWMADELARIGRRAVVLPPWVDVGPERVVAGDSIALAGRLVRHKAPELAVEAWRRAGRPLPLRIAGAGPCDVAADDVVSLGWLEHEHLIRELRRARVLLFPARWQEPFGLVGVEALAQGTPVVVSDVGGTRDWSGHGCIHVPAGDVEAMADAVRAVAEDPGRALELGRAGQLHVARRFARDALEGRLWDVWETAAAGSATP